ncbi:hypothetical protein [Paraburkholderia sp. J12]|uniref:hypothetical protein n=1 Tax=Paraburkholderia sp. J12 TaxID=2805432 RepID=UPI002ABD3267|nr:hypothetical protein [Paraburkholderia sp. J12]
MPGKHGKGVSRRHLTREMLLPIPAAKAQMRSMRAHLALVAMRKGQGNGSLAGELVKSVYMTWLLARDSGCTDPAIFEAAEIGLQRCIELVPQDGLWKVDETACVALEAVLRMQDEQLATIPAYLLRRAAAKMEHVIDSGRLPSVRDAHETSGAPDPVRH